MLEETGVCVSSLPPWQGSGGERPLGANQTLAFTFIQHHEWLRLLATFEARDCRVVR
jgi:hypothetical protein